MSINISRRGLILTGVLGLGALAHDGRASAQTLLQARGFTHGVASGEPSAQSVLLWTRHVGAEDGSALNVEVAESPHFGRLVAGGSIHAHRSDDHTARFRAEGLEPGRWYFYRFIADDGAVSPIGRTRTLPVGPVDRFGLGVFSCSNLGFGWFNAYAHASMREDLDLMVHTGDYIYEYARGYYPGADAAVRGRLIEPADEILQLADYRLRYASYRADPDLQRLHQQFPMIVQWDDHESANDAWVDGAENHGLDEGDWAARKAAAIKAHHEWMPVSGAMWSSYDIGDLATLFRPETRLAARSARMDAAEIAEGAENIAAAFSRLREGALVDPARTMMGTEQEAWLHAGLAQSKARGARWQVLAQQTVMGNLMMPDVQISPMLRLFLPRQANRRLRISSAQHEARLPLDFDNWGGFPAARSRLLQAAQAADANLVVLSGDSHNAWAFDLSENGEPAGVEFAGQSVTSPGFEAYLPMSPARVASLLSDVSPELKWANTNQRGYMSIDITPERVSSEWVFMNTITSRSAESAASATQTVAYGRRVLGD
jgi:alkaline phosphatase D